MTSLADPGREQVYFADGFIGFGANRWAVRTGGDPAQIAGAVRAAVAEVNPQYLVTDLRPMDALVLQAQASTRFSLMLIGVFAVMAALLVAVGLYGVLSTVVRQRTAEIGAAWRLGGARPDPSPRGRPRLAVERGGRAPGHRCRGRPHPCDDDNAGRCQAHGPADVRRDGRAVLRHCHRVVMAAGAARGGTGSHDGPEEWVMHRAEE